MLYSLVLAGMMLQLMTWHWCVPCIQHGKRTEDGAWKDCTSLLQKLR